MTIHAHFAATHGAAAPGAAGPPRTSPAPPSIAAAPPPPEAPPRLLADDALVPARLRVDGWTPARQRDFIEALADGGDVAAAAAAVDMTPQSAHRLRRRADAKAFAAAWEAALEHAVSGLMATACARAVHGAARARYFRGEKIGEERVPSDRLLIWLIEKGRAQLGRAAGRRAVSRDWEGAMAALADPDCAGAPVGGYRVWMSECGYPVTNLPPGEDFEGGSYAEGAPGDPGYRRSLSDAEEDAWLPADDRGAEAAHAARARLFPALDESENDARNE